MAGKKKYTLSKQAPPDGADVSGGGRDDDGVEDDDDEDRVNPIRGCLLFYRTMTETAKFAP